MQTLLVSLSSASQIYVSAVDSNIKCSVHLKFLSLPNMGTMKSLNLAWKHRQTDCKCVNVGQSLSGYLMFIIIYINSKKAQFRRNN